VYFDWNEDTIRWYLDSETYTGFFKHLAGVIAPMLADCKTLCDIGCGLALFDFEVHPLLDRIDCVDVSETALASVEERAEKLGIRKIHTRHRDSHTLTDSWDAVYMSFFGSRELDRYLPLCKKLIAVVSGPSDELLFPRRTCSFAHSTIENAKVYLERRGISFELTAAKHDFGQPLATRKDAEHFVRSYFHGASEEEIHTFLEQRLTETGDPAFPYYIPRTKTVGIFEVDGHLP
jgi:hypothetical protein